MNHQEISYMTEFDAKYLTRFVLLAFTLCFLFSCEGDKKREPTVTVELETKMDTLSEEQLGVLISSENQTIELSHEEKTNSVASSSSEKTADQKLIIEAKDQLTKSRYTTCNDVLLDYKKCIEDLKRGNKDSMMNFPFDSDPTCLICSKNDEFNQKLDSLKRIAKKVAKELKTKEF